MNIFDCLIVFMLCLIISYGLIHKEVKIYANVGNVQLLFQYNRITYDFRDLSEEIKSYYHQQHEFAQLGFAIRQDYQNAGKNLVPTFDMLDILIEGKDSTPAASTDV